MKRTVSFLLAFVLIFGLCVFVSPKDAKAAELQHDTLVYDPEATGAKFYYESNSTEVAGKDDTWSISDDGSVLTLKNGFTYETYNDIAIYVKGVGGSIKIEGTVTLGAMYGTNAYYMNGMILIEEPSAANNQEFNIYGDGDPDAKLKLTNPKASDYLDELYDSASRGIAIIYTNNDGDNSIVLNVHDLNIEMGTEAKPLDDGFFSYCKNPTNDVLMNISNVNVTSYVFSSTVNSMKSVAITGSTINGNFIDLGMNVYKSMIFADYDISIDGSTIVTEPISVTEESVGCITGCIHSLMGSIDITDSSITATGCSEFGIISYYDDYSDEDIDLLEEGYGAINITDSTIDLKDFELQQVDWGPDWGLPQMGIASMPLEKAKVTIKNSTVNVLGDTLAYGITTAMGTDNSEENASRISVTNSTVNANGYLAAIGGLLNLDPTDDSDYFIPITQIIDITGESMVDAQGEVFGIAADMDINIALAGKGKVRGIVEEAEYVGPAAIATNSSSTITLAEDNIITVPEDGQITKLYGVEFVASKANPNEPALEAVIEVDSAPKTGMESGAYIIAAAVILASLLLAVMFSVKYRRYAA